MAEAGCHHFFSFNKPKQGTPPHGLALTADRAPPALLWELAVPRTDCALTSMVFVPDRPHCPSCGEPMWLVRVVQTGPHLSERRFECACCDAKDVRVEPH